MVAPVTVVVNTLDRCRLLDKALSGLMQQRYRRFEIVVVDGPSRDETQAVLARYSQVRIGRCLAPNLSMSRNIGLAMARGEIVAFLDDDAVPEPNWLDRLAAAYDAPDVGAVGGFIRDRSGIAYQARVTVCDRFGDAQDFASLPDAASLDQDRRYLSPTGANVSYRRAALLEVGGFDERFAYFLDETDVNLRLCEAGWRLRFAEGAQVHHQFAQSAQRDERNVPRSLHAPCRSKAYFALRHARSEGWPGTVLSHLADHGIALRGHNSALLDGGLIDAAHKDRLDADVQRGLCEGAALSLRRPSLIRSETLDAHAGERFAPVSPRAPSEQRLRIGFATRQYPPGAVGGIAVWTHNAARALVELGHEVSVITFAGEEPPSVAFQDGVWVHQIAGRPVDRNAPPLPDLPLIVADYAGAVYEAAADIMARRGLDLLSWPIWDLEGLAVQRTAMLPTLVSLHTTYALAAPFQPGWRGDVYRKAHVDKVVLAEARVLDSAPQILANTRQALLDVERASGVRLDRPGVSVVAHGLHDRSAGVTSSRCDDRVRLLFVGRMEQRKGVDLLLNIIADILLEHPQVEIRLIGDSLPLEGGLTAPEAFAQRFGAQPWSDRVVFEGAVSAERLDQAYADCDIFVAPSRYETFGLVFVEAMMFGKPCIALDVGGVGEVIVHGGTGLLASPQKDSLKAAMVSLITDAGLRRRMGEAGRARYLAEFTAEQMAERLETVFRDAVAEAARGVPTDKAHACERV